MTRDLDLLILGPRSNNNSKPRPTTMKPRGGFSIFDEHHDALTRASGKQNANAPPPNTMPPQRPGTNRANIKRRRAPPVQTHCDAQEKHVASRTTRCKTPLSGAVRVLQATSRVVDRVGSGGGKENVPPGCEGVSAEKLGWEQGRCSKIEISVSVGVRDGSTAGLRTVEGPQLDRRIAMRAPEVVVSSLTDDTPQTARQDLSHPQRFFVVYSKPLMRFLDSQWLVPATPRRSYSETHKQIPLFFSKRATERTAISGYALPKTVEQPKHSASSSDIITSTNAMRTQVLRSLLTIFVTGFTQTERT